MKNNFYDDQKENAAFERCIGVLAELIEKYAGRFALSDIGYEYFVVSAFILIVTPVFSNEDYQNRFCGYYRHPGMSASTSKQKCQKAC